MATKLAVTALSAALFAAACTLFTDIPSAPTPQTLPTPRPLPERATIADAIAWLDGAGLVVRIVDAPEDALRGFGTRNVEQVSVNGYDSVWIIEYDEPQSSDALWQTFDLNADFTPSGFPTLITVANVVFLVRGMGEDAIYEVLAAVWDMAPTAELAPLSILRPNYEGRAEEITRIVADWLNGQPGAEEMTETGQAAVLTTFKGFAELWGFEPLVSNLPHPDTTVWVTAFANADRDEFITVASDLMTAQPLAQVRTDVTLDVSALPAISLPEFSLPLMTGDGEVLHDGARVSLLWSGGRNPLDPDAVWVESTESYVVERTLQGEGNWRAVAWLNDNARDMTQDPPEPFMPPDGIARKKFWPDEPGPEFEFVDLRVEPGVTYDYRIYACTSLGRQTPYSDVVTATAADPDPATPHQESQPAQPVTPACSREAD